MQQHYNLQHYIQYIEKQHNNQQHNDNGASKGPSENNRTLIVGPSFCGKTHLLLNMLRLFRLNDYETNSSLRQIRIITRSPEQYEDVKLDLELGDALQDTSVEENVEDLETYRGCCVVFVDMLDSNVRN